MATEKIGFIGVGLMGEGMVANILKGGYPVTVIPHRHRGPVEALLAQGATEATSLAELAEANSIIHICAPGSPQVEAIVAEMLPALKPDTVIIDCSTSDPTSTEKLAQLLQEKDCHLADAPLGGTPVQAAAGQLAAMVGADPDIFDRIKPVLETWTGSMAHIGPTGAGHKMKLLNNMVSLGYAAIYAEALALSEKVGISTQQFDSVIRGSRMDCGFYQTFMGYAVEGNREAHKFTISNALKDMRYLEAMAHSVNLANPVGNAIKNTLSEAYNTGGDGPENYVPHLVDFIAARNGVTRN